VLRKVGWADVRDGDFRGTCDRKGVNAQHALRINVVTVLFVGNPPSHHLNVNVMPSNMSFFNDFCRSVAVNTVDKLQFSY